MRDVRLEHTPDGGEIEVINGRFTRDDGLRTAAYLSLFGGNADDDGTSATEDVQWWGNVTEQDAARHLRSETQHLLRSLPAVPANLVRLEEAAGRDLDWMTGELGADITVRATMPGLNRIQLAIGIEIDGTLYELLFSERWGMT